MLKLLCSVILAAVSMSSFAVVDINCSNSKGDTVEARITITGEPETNGTWNYVSAQALVKFGIQGRTGELNKNTVMILTKHGWELDAYKIYHGYSEMVQFFKKNNKITARYVDHKTDVKLSCKEVLILSH